MQIATLYHHIHHILCSINATYMIPSLLLWITVHIIGSGTHLTLELF